MKCPECGGELIIHPIHKAGNGHCNACGICWAPEDIKPKRTRKVTRGTDD